MRFKITATLLVLALASHTLAQGASSSDAVANRLVARVSDAVALRNRSEKPERSLSLPTSGSARSAPVRSNTSPPSTKTPKAPVAGSNPAPTARPVAAAKSKAPWRNPSSPAGGTALTKYNNPKKLTLPSGQTR
ncbi:hypothetical protein H4R33_002302 [Dimargaris cristalligena]|uniref:Uncharacterized protein n=1 Tax=Dimargaris cristalligena TaxID=215637 RepID=A0A4P9ZK14_9FUNG|nr:hypothetical protein H4R33_002302 [Dimargaris cristalligena]RKP33413.1 hypothetical protein BJ085DRAFT_37940 [Dimargaris cristalligena]|eukprot:RKP33413.1 hypothetical protein BJ085DRAFT_37940 [Dimargaris cristalligena]